MHAYCLCQQKTQHCRPTDSFRGAYARANAIIAPSASIMNGYHHIYNCNGRLNEANFLDQKLHLSEWNCIALLARFLDYCPEILKIHCTSRYKIGLPVCLKNIPYIHLLKHDRDVKELEL